jgi:SsrA-binding protein
LIEEDSGTILSEDFLTKENMLMEKTKFIAQNRKARHDYFILDSLEAGIVLQGTEVKSLREGRVNLKDSYARIKDGELWLIGMHISPYEQGNIFNHDPERTRKLLMHTREIEKLRRNTEEKGLTLVPLSLYFKEGRVKVELGLAKGKHTYDKREDTAEREAKREMDRARKKMQYS